MFFREQPGKQGVVIEQSVKCIGFWGGKKYLHCNSLCVVGCDDLEMGFALGMALVQKSGVHCDKRKYDRELISISDFDVTWTSTVVSALVYDSTCRKIKACDGIPYSEEESGLEFQGFGCTSKSTHKLR